jgi:hypothetical protein
LCLYSRKSAEIRERVRTAANVVVDAVVENLRKYALEHSLEPLDVPDITKTFIVVSRIETSRTGRLMFNLVAGLNDRITINKYQNTTKTLMFKGSI